MGDIHNIYPFDIRSLTNHLYNKKDKCYVCPLVAIEKSFLYPHLGYMEQFRGTTILSVRRNGKVAVGGDGQVSMGDSIMKGNARKVRRLYHDRVLTGFAGGTADAFTLFERLEAKLEKHQGHLLRAAVELAKDWRTDKLLRRLEALLIAADSKVSLLISGNGDVIEPEENIIAIGSGGNYARAAAHALMENTKLSAKATVEKGLQIASEICVYTNNKFIIDELNSDE